MTKEFEELMRVLDEELAKNNLTECKVTVVNPECLLIASEKVSKLAAELEINKGV